MAQTTNLNVSPYFDDFNENDNYYKVLFKPGVPVQARELTGLQSILQNQIAKFGQHFFKEGSKVGILSSRVGSIADNSSSNNYGYRVSKTAVNMVGKCLSLDLAPQGVAVALLHPGFVRTEMTAGNGLIDANESASGLLKRMDELTLETSGIYIHTSGEVLPW